MVLVPNLRIATMMVTMQNMVEAAVAVPLMMLTVVTGVHLFTVGAAVLVAAQIQEVASKMVVYAEYGVPIQQETVLELLVLEVLMGLAAMVIAVIMGQVMEVEEEAVLMMEPQVAQAETAELQAQEAAEAVHQSQVLAEQVVLAEIAQLESIVGR